MVNKMIKLDEIVSTEQIKIILENYRGEKQLLELKFYFLQFRDELKEAGIDPSRLAWDIYKTNRKPF